MSNKTKLTTRKFYNLWNYKLSFRIKGVTALRLLGLPGSSISSKSEEIEAIARELSLLDTKSYAKRIESNIIDIYTNDEKIFNNLYEKFKDYLRHSFAPHPDLESLDNGHTILTKKLPHDIYKYKVFLQPHRISSREEKEKYMDWVDKQKPKVHITDTVKNWFHKTHWNWDRRYMYVEDEQMLLMLKLKKPEALGTIYTFVISDK